MKNFRNFLLFFIIGAIFTLSKSTFFIVMCVISVLFFICSIFCIFVGLIKCSAEIQQRHDDRRYQYRQEINYGEKHESSTVSDFREDHRIVYSILSKNILNILSDKYRIGLTEHEKNAIVMAVNIIPESSVDSFSNYVSNNKAKSLFMFDRVVKYIKQKKQNKESINYFEIYAIFKMVDFF